MALDGLFLNKLLTEIAPHLLDAKINRVHQPDRYTVTLKLKSRTRGGCTLLLTAHPQNARLQLTDAAYDNPKTPPLFAMVLRKHIEGGRIVNITQAGLDRVADITVEARNEIGDTVERHLIVEIMGKHSNIILCDNDMTILAAAKQYGNNVSRYRQVLPHEAYILPPPSGKVNPFFLSEEEFTAVLTDQELSLTLPKALLKTMDGISPQTAAEIVYRAGLESSETLDTAGIYEYQRLYEEIQKLFHAEAEPTLIVKDGATKDFYFVPALHYEGETVPREDLSSLLDAYFVAKERESAFSSRKANLVRFIAQHRDKTAKKVAKQREELEHAIDGEKYRLYGELLSANLYQIPKNTGEVTLENFYEDMTPLTIPLKPELSPADNAGMYFKKYNKAKTSRNAIREHLEKNEEELVYLESLCFQAETAINDDDLGATKSELTHSGYIKEHKRSTKEKYDAPLPPIETVYEGYTILIGRNNKQNDRLTLKTAQKDDLWLHTKDIPGSHVIIRRKGNEAIPEEVILRAARYAAFHSKAAASPKVPVDYTEVKQVKKPNGARPGMVIYFNQTTIMAEPLEEEK